MAKNDQYFPHDYQARNDVKCLFMRHELGMEGYGIFWFVVESLADAGGFLPAKVIPLLAMQMGVDTGKVDAVVRQFDLFDFDGENFFSNRLNLHLQKRAEISKVNSLNGKLGGALKGRKAVVKRSLSKEKEKKGKEIKEKERYNPYGVEGFLPLWQKWLDYKKAEHRESYKSDETEKIAIDKLFSLSGGSLILAEKIIDESIANCWKGLFQLKKLDDATNQRSKGANANAIDFMHKVNAAMGI